MKNFTINLYRTSKNSKLFNKLFFNCSFNEQNKQIIFYKHTSNISLDENANINEKSINDFKEAIVKDTMIWDKFLNEILYEAKNLAYENIEISIHFLNKHNIIEEYQKNIQTSQHNLANNTIGKIDFFIKKHLMPALLESYIEDLDNEIHEIQTIYEPNENNKKQNYEIVKKSIQMEDSMSCLSDNNPLRKKFSLSRLLLKKKIGL
jgi:hypothetical protein